jgi:hypothetical protein
VRFCADESDHAIAGGQIPQLQLAPFLSGPLESTTLAGRSKRL